VPQVNAGSGWPLCYGPNAPWCMTTAIAMRPLMGLGPHERGCGQVQRRDAVDFMLATCSQARLLDGRGKSSPNHPRMTHRFSHSTKCHNQLILLYKMTYPSYSQGPIIINSFIK